MLVDAIVITLVGSTMKTKRVFTKQIELCLLVRKLMCSTGYSFAKELDFTGRKCLGDELREKSTFDNRKLLLVLLFHEVFHNPKAVSCSVGVSERLQIT